ncbi:uncharacterized protein LOC105176742 [Sesamum indicum]|uniref:Uncharacterized protein LOC105176742 n=1 Tax=Sesamum indicum TaxID=4182 RepID=A0A6I9UDD1_SESIN|nr:uncharacterized protein LOC105176742 [Sesamum indicum]
MRFFLEFVTCCGSCTTSGGTRHPAEERKLLVVEEPPPRRTGRRHGRVRGRGRGRQWTPSLSSISEDSLVVERIRNAERPNKAGWRRSLKRKVAALRSERDRSRSFDRDTDRQPPVSALMPTFSATPFMF